MDKIINEEQVLLGSMIFILIAAIPKDEPSAKITRKKVSRTIKKELAKFRNVDAKLYMSIINEASETIRRAKDRMLLKSDTEEDLQNMKITPSDLIYQIRAKEPELINCFNIDEKVLEEMHEVYKHSGLGFRSRMFSTRLLEEIKVTLKNIKG